jgi:antitoxin component YwqK of YwqJK toxin-antitoxin module
MGIFDWFSEKKKKTSNTKEDKKSKPNEHRCYKCGINASKEGYMCTPCAKETAKQMKDGTYQLKDEENENIKRIVGDLMKEPEIIEKYSFDSDNESYYQLLDEKIDSEFSGEVEHILFDRRDNKDDLVIAHIEAIHKVKGNYKNGIRDGIFQLFYTQGNLAHERCYRKGVIDGTEKMYFVSGNIVNEWNYKDGVEHGPRIQYLESGKIQIHSIIKNGKIQGVQKGYNDNGDLFYEDMYKDDMRDGERKSYYENGQLQQISEEKMNQRHGITIEYYDDGQIKSLGRYNNGNLLGSVIQYDKLIDNNQISSFNKYVEKSTSLQSTKILKQIDVKWLKKISVFDGSTIREGDELIDKDGLHSLLNVPIYIKGKIESPVVISNHDIEEAKFTIDGIVNELSEENNFELIKDKDYCYESEELIIRYMMPLKSITIMLKKETPPDILSL